MGKKDAELIKKELGKFCERAMALRPPARSWSTTWPAQIETFGRYGFNKSHSVAYSVLSLPDGVAQGALPGRVHGGAAVVGNRQYRQGGAVHQRGARAGARGAAAGRERVGLQVHRRRRAAGSASASAPSATSAGAPSSRSSPARQDAPFTALADFVERIDLRLCNKRVLESLIVAGACDGLGGHRKQLCEALDGGARRGAAAAAGEGGRAGIAVRRRRWRRQPWATGWPRSGRR